MSREGKCPVCNAPVTVGTTACERCGFKLVGRTEEFPAVQAADKIAGLPAELTSGNVPAPTLTILKGPLQGVTFNLTHFPLVVGRDPECDLFLNDTTVTRRHASLDIIGNEVVLADLSSLNGTWVNGRVCDRVALKDGYIVQIGTFTMIFNM